MNEDSMPKLLKGTVEIDETYIGGKPSKENEVGSENHEPMLALVERNGNVVSKPIERVDAKTLKSAIKEICHEYSCIMTDELASYTKIGKDFNGSHEIVKHNDR